MAQPAVAMAWPMVVPQVEAWLAQGPEQVDAHLTRVAEAVLAMRSDTPAHALPEREDA